MKRVIIILCCILTVAITAVHAEINYKITGKISGLHNKQVYMEPVYFTPIPGDDTALHTFSANGEFEFSGIANEIKLYRVCIDDINKNCLVIVANETIFITGSADDIEHWQITASAENAAFRDYMALNSVPIANDTSSLRNFIVTHPQRFASLLICHRSAIIPSETLLELLSLLDVSLKGHSLYKRLEEKAKTEIRLRINMPAPDFTITMPDGASFTLTSLRGKYVLLDFWASWCAPCRAANQSLKSMMNTYKAKGFEVVSFSIDQKIKEWQKAVERDGISWTSLVDFKAWQSATAILYNVQEIPVSFLISPDGKIIAKNLTPEELEMRLKQLLKE